MANEEEIPEREQDEKSEEGQNNDSGLEESTEEPAPEVASRYLSLRISRRTVWLLIIVLLLGAAAVTVWKYRLYQPIWDRYNAASVTLEVREGATFALEGAQVKVKSVTYTADHNGKVQLAGLTAGTYSVSVTKDGYQPVTQTLSLHRGDNDLTYLAMTKLPTKSYAVKGFVKDYVSGEPLVNVQVTLASQTVQTDPSGEYAFTKVAPGDIKLVLSKAGYADLQLAQTVKDSDVVTASVPLVPTGEVIFVSNRDGLRSLYKTGYDGKNQSLFVPPVNGGEDFDPAPSPTKQWIAFSSTRDKVKDAFGNDLAKLYLAKQDGTQVKKAEDTVAPYFTPIWSPDGQYLYIAAFATPQQDQPTSHVYGVAKGNVIDIGEAAAGLVFSPDSTVVAYSVTGSEQQPVPSDAPPGTEPVSVNVNYVKTLNLVTGERKTLATRSQYVSDLRFSSTGEAVSYEVVVDGVRRRFEVALATPGTESEIPVIPFSKRQYVPSPDHSLLAFVEERDGKKDLFVVDQSEQNERKLTDLGVVDDGLAPIWDVTGRYITFAVKREGENALYVVGLTGDPQKITDFYAGQ